MIIPNQVTAASLPGFVPGFVEPLLLPLVIVGHQNVELGLIHTKDLLETAILIDVRCAFLSDFRPAQVQVLLDAIDLREVLVLPLENQPEVLVILLGSHGCVVNLPAEHYHPYFVLADHIVEHAFTVGHAIPQIVVQTNSLRVAFYKLDEFLLVLDLSVAVGLFDSIPIGEHDVAYAFPQKLHKLLMSVWVQV